MKLSLIGLRMAKEWISMADDLAIKMSKKGLKLTRTDILRMAIALGLEDLKKAVKHD